MSRSELAEWIVMILVIILWWPVIFLGWAPRFYQYPLYVFSAVSLLVIFVRRLGRMNEGFRDSEGMMRTKIAAEEQARGGRPSLDEKAPPDVSSQLPFMPGGRPPDTNDEDDG